MPRTPPRPAVEDMLTMAPPPPASMAGISYFMARKTPRRLTRMARSKSSTAIAASGAGMWPAPALLNAASRRPYASRVRATRCSTAAGSPTSVGTASAWPPAAVMSPGDRVQGLPHRAPRARRGAGSGEGAGGGGADATAGAGDDRDLTAEVGSGRSGAGMSDSSFFMQVSVRWRRQPSHRERRIVARGRAADPGRAGEGRGDAKEGKDADGQQRAHQSGLDGHQEDDAQRDSRARLDGGL